MTATTDQTTPPDGGPGRWENWGGNLEFEASHVVRPRDEDELVQSVRSALARGSRLRAAGSGHSFTPVVTTHDTLLLTDDLSGVVSTDPSRCRATVLGGTKLHDLGAPFWAAGMSLANQGDIDQQSIAGATATGTKGSGVDFGTLSSMIRGGRFVNGHGDLVTVTEDDPDLLRAFQVSIGMLGVVVSIDLQLVPAYRLQERNAVLDFADVDAAWDSSLEDYRHFSFWWMATDRSSAMYDLGEVAPNGCVTKMLREVSIDDPTPDSDEPLNRCGPAYRIYPDATTEARFHELEYMVPADRAKEAVDVMQRLMLDRFPDEISPLQVRWQKGDDAMLSPHYGTDTTSISVSGQVGHDYEPFLRAVDRELAVFGARPHWGKLHFLTRERVEELYPELDTFEAIRREHDPRGVFLNAHLGELFR